MLFLLLSFFFASHLDLIAFTRTLAVTTPSLHLLASCKDKKGSKKEQT
jgi:hypothetical protein